MPAPLAPFSLPDRYRLEGGIAAGGMAAVYAAHDQVLDRPVAVKVLAEHLNEDTTARRRFQREARAAAALSSHPAVVTIFDVGEHEGRSFIVMELRTGGTIGEQLAAGPVDPRRALSWLRATADALDAAHERGVVHRDIKPGNLLLDEHDRVAVADFGIASLAHESDRFTVTGQVLGTAAYLSPEQATGEPATAASDRYSLAAVAYELLTGRKPFEASHFAAQARAHIEDPVPSASMHNPQLPRAVDAVLRRGLAKDPADRWATATAFVAALEAALDGSPTEATRPMPVQAAAVVPDDSPVGTRRSAVPDEPRSPAHRPAAVAPPPPPEAPGRRREAQPGRGRRIPVAAAVAALALVAAAAAAIALGGGGQEPSPPSRAAERPAGSAKADRTPTAEPTADATQTPQGAATATPDDGAGQASGGSEPSGTPSSLNDEGYRFFEAGDYAAAIPYFRKAVETCGDSMELVCAYATYNLGASLNRSGDPAEAIPILQRRLDRWPDDQRDTVEAELAQACEAAGQDCGAGEDAAAATGGEGSGKGKGKGRGRGRSGAD